MLILWDFLCLWAGSRVAIRNGNIYDQMEVVNELLSNAHVLTRLPDGFHNPPWSLWIFVGIGSLPFLTAAIIWTIATIVSFAYCTSSLIKHPANIGLDNITLSKFDLSITLICFFPFLKHLIVGQSSFLVLLGLVLFLIYFSKEKFLLAGLLLSISCIKLNLFIVLLIFIVTASSKKQAFRPIIYGLIIGVSAQAIISYALFPQSYKFFFDFIFNFAGARKSNPQATLPHVLQLYTGFDNIHEISFSISIFLALYLSLTKELSISYLVKTILPLSLIFTPYSWSHDHVVLLPAYLLAAQVIKEKYPKDFIPIIVIPFILTLGLMARNIVKYEHIALWLPVALLWINYYLRRPQLTSSKT